MTGGQVYEALLLLGWSERTLAKKAGISRSTLWRFTSQRHTTEHVPCQPATERAIVDTFLAEGIAFIELGDLPWIQIVEKVTA